MREIKFRIWDSILGFYVKVENYFLRNSKIYYDNCGYYVDQTKTLILEQYTSLKDKNGKEIYEGDKDVNGRIVIFKDGCFWLHDKYRGDQLLYAVCKNIEIIGNIHEGEEKC